jgi:hypothetical protein
VRSSRNRKFFAAFALAWGFGAGASLLSWDERPQVGQSSILAETVTASGLHPAVVAIEQVLGSVLAFLLFESTTTRRD